MGNILFEHNRKAYEAAVSMLEETGRAAIVHPTGTGKSFIAFQLCADAAGDRCEVSARERVLEDVPCEERAEHTYEILTKSRVLQEFVHGDGAGCTREVSDGDKILEHVPRGGEAECTHTAPAGAKVCWLSPSEYIFMTQMEKWRAAGGAELNNIEFITYARLMRMGAEALAEIRPGYIILDEFHRCGAAQWGGGVSRLREMYPETKVLGLSATNIRYLDNQRDMAWELFGGNVASELTLGAAIAQGILPAPKYVLSVYSYQNGLKRYEQKVQQTRNRAVRDEAARELEALRRALEKADGLAEVFERHMAGEGTVGTAEAKAAGAGDAGRKTPAETSLGAGSAGRKTPAETGPGAGNAARKTTAEKSAGATDAGRENPENTETGNLANKKGHKHCGKYLVFCANYEHLIEMRELAPEWFAKVDTAPHIYTAYSDHPETSAEFAAFKADETEHLKLLYCIDMLNEGIHVDGVDGVILLRPTASPTIYKQQVGRALASGGKKTPVVFDIVMNIENLCSIGAVEEELRGAVFSYRMGGRGAEIVNEHFRVVDELGDCRRLFAQLNETLGASWEAMYAMAAEYYAEHGNLSIPAKYTTADGYSLGAWIATQRKVYTGKTAGCLSAEQARRLEKIGMRWQGVQEAAWERNFAGAEKYFREHGDLDIPAGYVAENGCKLGRWLRRQREVYRRLAKQGQGVEDVISCETLEDSVAAGLENPPEASGTDKNPSESKPISVHQKRAQRLTQIGMVWETEDPWEWKYGLAKQYYEEHGNLRMAADYVIGLRGQRRLPCSLSHCL